MFKETENGLILNLKISPNASKNMFVMEESGLKVKITAQPIDGKANKVLTEFLSKKFKIPKTSIQIVKGETSKEKTILFITSDTAKINLLKETL